MMHKKVVGLTGSIASGKSTVSRLLEQQFGGHIICADSVGKEVAQKGQEGYRKILELFSTDFLQEDGELDRKKLGNYVFAHPEELQKLNGCLHPIILDTILQRAKDLTGLVVIDCALLIETELYRHVDEVWLVYAPKELRIQRVMARDGVSYEDALNRVNSQMPDEQKKKYAQRVIFGDRDEAYLLEQLQQILGEQKVI